MSWTVALILFTASYITTLLCHHAKLLAHQLNENAPWPE